MEYGVGIVKRDETETKAIFIDQETVEFAQQNALVKKRVAEEERAQREAASKRRKEEIAQTRRKRYNLNTAGYVLTRVAIAGGMAWGGLAGMIHPVIYIPAATFCLCVAFARCGLWIGKNSERRHTHGR